MSLTLQDHIFPVAWFSMWMKCPCHALCQTILYPGLHFKSHLPGCLFCKVDMISNLKSWFVSCQSLLSSCDICFCLVFSWQWLVLACGFPDLICLSQDLQENVAWVPEADVMVGWGSLPYTRKNGGSAVAKIRCNSVAGEYLV